MTPGLPTTSRWSSRGSIRSTPRPTVDLRNPLARRRLMSGKNTVVVGVYPTRAGADAAVEVLKGNGFRDTDVSVLVPQTVGPGQTPERSGTGGPSKMPALLALEQS